jgi:hypothetical protein
MLGSDPLPDANIPQKLDAILKEKRKRENNWGNVQNTDFLGCNCSQACIIQTDLVANLETATIIRIAMS